MLRELIERIMGLRYSKEDDMKWCWDRCLDEVLKIIESYKPKVLDMPDSEGWWWNNAIGDWRACRVYEGSGINGNDWDYPMWADKKGAKWIKADIPELE